MCGVDRERLARSDRIQVCLKLHKTEICLLQIFHARSVFVCYLFTSGSASILVLQFTFAIRQVHGIISTVCIIHIEAFFARVRGRAAADDVAAS
jgi:hypothetical protein